MKAHVEIRIHLNLDNGKTLHDVLRHFGRRTKGWKFPAKKSKGYQSDHRGPAGFAVCDSVEGLERAAVALANLNPKRACTFRVTNIIPRTSSSLTMDQYNAIGAAFAKSFRSFLRKSGYRGSVRVSGPEKKLADIIRGAKCRSIFEAWLHTPTPRSHPGDIHVLHVFICALFRDGASTRSYEIEQFLVEDRGWKPEVAKCVAAEIEKGLQILWVNREFKRWV